MASAEATDKRSVVFSDPPTSSSFVSSDVAIADLNKEVMDVAFVKAIDTHNYPGGLRAYMKDHRFDDGVHLGDHWRHKFLVDLDGMGYSGRFFAFLESRIRSPSPGVSEPSRRYVGRRVVTCSLIQLES